MTRVYQISPYKIPTVNLKFEVFSRTYVRVTMTFDYEATNEWNGDPLILYSRGVNTVQIIYPKESKYEAHFRPVNHPREDSSLVFHTLPKNGQITIYSHLNPSLNNPSSGLYMDGETLILDGSKDGLMYATYFLPTLMANLAQITTEVITRQIPQPSIDVSGIFITEKTFQYKIADLKYKEVLQFVKKADLLGKWCSQVRTSIIPLHSSQFNLQAGPRKYLSLVPAYTKQRYPIPSIPVIEGMVPSPPHSPAINI